MSLNIFVLNTSIAQFTNANEHIVPDKGVDAHRNAYGNGII